GRVLDTLESNSAVAANTIVLFTADHGEYGGSHGLRNKGAGAYEEAIHVPFYVKDRRGILNRNPELERNQITSHVDVAALLLTMATGGSTWRQQSQFAQIAGRADMASILVNPGASGRSFAIHATDEPLFDEFSVIRPPVIDADHVIALIHPAKKFATYSFWKDGSIDILARGMELESYDYSSEGGRRELDNVAYSHPAVSAASLSLLNTQAIPNELRQPLPANLKGAQHKAFEAYFELLEALGPLA
ncbi:MAG: sulfatase-like hydrolase/transferase, partial [Bryobacteraceae bacterium]|nr:sulfatase-like hydrolase/transferase [Bryobacteraceae bacterium]